MSEGVSVSLLLSLTNQLQRSSSLKEQSGLDFSVHALSGGIDCVGLFNLIFKMFPGEKR